MDESQAPKKSGLRLVVFFRWGIAAVAVLLAYFTGRSNAPSLTERSQRFQWPVAHIRVTQPFRPMNNPRHQGLDLGGYKGADILAAHDGKVIFAGRNHGGYGKMVLIESDEQWTTLYAHLQSIKVQRGQSIAAGSVIGTMGHSGHAWGTHLHFELRKDQRAIDPVSMLETRGSN